MVNTRRKGNRVVNKCVEKLDRMGYIASKVESPSKFAKQKDLFGLWDVIAISPRVVKLIQVKTNKKPNLNKYKSFSKTFPYFDCQVWVWFDRKGFKVYELNPNLKI